MSYHALGKAVPAARRDDLDFQRVWKGLSVYDSVEGARDAARAFDPRRKRWTHIGVLHIPEDAPIDYEGPDEHGHLNLFLVDPNYLRDECLVRILPVDERVEVSPDS